MWIYSAGGQFFTLRTGEFTSNDYAVSWIIRTYQREALGLASDGCLEFIGLASGVPAPLE